MSMPVISVIIPTFNAQKTIYSTLQSVLDQSFTEFEIVVINDGSTDETLTVIQQILDPRLRVFSYANGGVATSRNRGIAQATGEFVAFLDADDLWHPDKLNEQFQALQHHPQAAVAYSWTDQIDSDGNFLRPGGHMTEMGWVYAKLLLINFIENGSNPLIRRQALIEVGEFDPSLVPADDRDMWLRLAARYEFVGIPAVHIFYRQSAHSNSANIAKQSSRSIRTLKKAFEQAPVELQYLKPYSYANIYKYMIVKALDTNASWAQNWIALQLFWRCLQTEPGLFKTKIWIKVLLRIGMQLTLPAQMVNHMTSQFNRALNITTLLNYTTVNIPSNGQPVMEDPSAH